MAVLVIASVVIAWIVIANLIPSHPEHYTASATILLAIFTVILVVVTGFLAWSALLEFKEAQVIHSLEFLLRIDQVFSTPHNMDIANKVIKAGYYKEPGTNPEEWNDLRRYMGLFERIQFFVEKEIIDIDYVNRVYYSKMEKIVNHEGIYNHILKGSQGWQTFQKLWCDLIEHRQKKKEETRDLNNYAKTTQRSL